MSLRTSSTEDKIFVCNKIRGVTSQMSKNMGREKTEADPFVFAL